MDILESLYNEPCIYCILNYDNGKMYFGLTKHFKTRVRDHVNDLKAIRHGNDYLQKAWNKKQKCAYGSEDIGEMDNDDNDSDKFEKEISTSKMIEEIVNHITKK